MRFALPILRETKNGERPEKRFPASFRIMKKSDGYSRIGRLEWDRQSPVCSGDADQMSFTRLRPYLGA
jgi:hypothetical protein